MSRFTALLGVLLSLSICTAKQDPQDCGTHPDRTREELALHRKLQRTIKPRSPQAAARAVLPDSGQIAILDDSDGVVARRNAFNLDKKTIQFLPSQAAALRYRFQTAGDTYDADADAKGTLLSGIGDDDSRDATLLFAFPFFGGSYRKISINSDGNATFKQPDASSADRSLGRMTAGPPRISPLFHDLDPTKSANGIRVLSEPSRFVVSWAQVPDYSDFGTGTLQTFQLRLYPDGKIEMAYSGVNVKSAVVGISPGGLQGSSSLVDFTTPANQEYDSTVAERFSDTEQVDIFTAAQKFYLNHEDAYDYLVIYNAESIPADTGAVAFEVTVRNNRSGYGDEKVDIGYETGSNHRLQSILNMGPLDQYPRDPNAIVPARFSSRDTPLTVLGHEAGHLFLAFASVHEGDDATSQPMLGRALVHWAFNFNSDASFLEGNRIQDNGPSASPRFTTTATVQGYSLFDQYLMGFRPAEEVPDTFYVRGATSGSASRSPQPGVSFDGERRNVSVSDIIQVTGRRTPDYTVSQRHFRMAFLLVTAAGTPPTAAQLAQLDAYRSQFENFYNQAASSNATMETRIVKAVTVSTFPAAGVLVGGTAAGTVTLDKAAPAPLSIVLRSRNGNFTAPSTVTIPAGQTQAVFQLTGTRQGTDDLSAEPADPAYETVVSRIQTANAADVKLAVASGDKQMAVAGGALPQPVVFRVTDVNELPYPGVRVQLAITGGGTVDNSTGTTGPDGAVSFLWTPGAGPINQLQASIPGGASAKASAIGQPAFTSGGIVNAASFAPGITPGSIATIFGTNLAGASSDTVEVSVAGRTAQVFYADSGQVNFLVPDGIASAAADVVVKTSAGASTARTVPVLALSPGIFFDSASGLGAVIFRDGGAIEIYTTGLGTVTASAAGLQDTVARPDVTVAGLPARLLSSTLAPGFPGLYQVNVLLPDKVPAGLQPLVISVNGIRSNTVKIQVK